VLLSRPRRPWDELPTGGPAELAGAIQDMRRVARFERKDLAAAADVSEATVAIIEQGRRPNPPLPLLVAFARAFRVVITALTDPFLMVLGRNRTLHHPAATNPMSLENVFPFDGAVTGLEGMGYVLKVVRGDRRRSMTYIADLAGIRPNHLGAIERGMVTNPGLLNVAKTIYALTGNRATLPEVAERVGVVVQVLAGELPASEAIRIHRQRWPLERLTYRLDESSGRTTSA
jgi:DNA-binding XRE family transcriptional regulator